MINHIEIYVSDLFVSSKFWKWLLVGHLGYKTYQKWEKGISYIKDSCSYIVFVQADKKKLALSYNRTRIGLNHLAFSIPDKSTLAQIKMELNALNYRELYADRYPHAGGKDRYALYFEDPDRIKVEIVVVE
ncbi:VOC family protein [Liquorilactobacillus oeni]|nr:VOC family protein [Liquorilactobacillus oeni]